MKTWKANTETNLAMASFHYHDIKGRCAKGCRNKKGEKRTRDGLCGGEAAYTATSMVTVCVAVAALVPAISTNEVLRDPTDHPGSFLFAS